MSRARLTRIFPTRKIPNHISIHPKYISLGVMISHLFHIHLLLINLLPFFIAPWMKREQPQLIKMIHQFFKIYCIVIFSATFFLINIFLSFFTQTVFGDKLVTKFTYDIDFTDEPYLPTPEQLRHRIIIKNKKILVDVPVSISSPR